MAQCPCYAALCEVLAGADPARAIWLIKQHRFAPRELLRAACDPAVGALAPGEGVPAAALVAAAAGDLASLQFFFGLGGAPAGGAFVLPYRSAAAYGNGCLYQAARAGHCACVAYLLAPDGARLSPADAREVLARLDAETAEAAAEAAACGAYTDEGASTWRPDSAVRRLLETGGTPQLVCYVNSDDECVCDAPHSP